MPRKKTSRKKPSRKSKSKDTSILQIVLWTLFILSLGALVLTIVTQCQHSDSFALNDTRDFLSEKVDKQTRPERRIPQDMNARAGNTDTCQNPLKFPENVRDDYKMTKLMPVLPTLKTTCNQVSDNWLKYASDEDVQNLTEMKDGKHYICNKSSPPAIVASGLNSSGLFRGVM
tara:strand:+ start:376 stop:894 length:519 start_codon:yes stop_codon:yes gene_type:complete